MGSMSIDLNDAAAYLVLASMVSMCPVAKEITQKNIADLGLSRTPIKETPPCKFGCRMHLAYNVLGFPKSLKHILGYDSRKNYVYNQLVRNAVNKEEWEDCLRHACRGCPDATSYLHTLSITKDRWDTPCRLDHSTVGMDASSTAEGSFSVFHRALDGMP